MKLQTGQPPSRPGSPTASWLRRAQEILRRPRYVNLRWNAGIALAALVLTGAIWVATLERVRYEEADTSANAVRQNSNLARALEEQTVRTLKGVDQALRYVRQEYRTHGSEFDMRELIEGGVIDDALFHFVGVIDANGKVVAGGASFPSVNLAARDFFLAQQRGRGDEMFIGKPVLGKITGNWVIPMSHRLDRPDGSFAGVVFAGVDPDYFTAFYQEADLGADGLVTLVGQDGITRARRVGDTKTFGQDMSGSSLLAEQARRPIGSFVSLGRIEGVSRFFSYRSLARYPLIVAVGTSRNGALAEFRQRETNYYTGASLASALVIVFAAGLVAALSRQRRSARAFAESEARFKQMAESIRDVFFLIDVDDSRMHYVSPAYEEIWGRSRESLYANPRSWTEAVHPDDRAHALEKARAGMKTGEFDYEYRIVRPDGEVRAIRVRGFPIRNEAGVAYRSAGVAEDVTERKRAQLELELQNSVLATQQETSLDAILLVDENAKIVSYNRQFVELWNIPEELIKATDDEPVLQTVVAQTRDPDGFLARVRHLYEHRHERSSDEILTKDGRTIDRYSAPVIGNDGRYHGRVWYFRDITERLALQDRLQHQAHYDALTELPNRVLCFDRLKRALSQARRRDWNVSFLFVDLDRFKNVNDTLGHAVGDRLLQQVAARISRAGRAEDTVARLGGDEFGVILSEVARPQDAAVVARKILENLAKPFALDGHEVFVTASVGIASYPSDSADPEALVNNADAAMYQAKLLGRNTYQFYTAAMNERALEKLTLENQLRRAIEREEFLLHFQPKTDLASGATTGFEALLRWKLPGNGWVPPSEFVPLLEDTGLIVPVGKWVIDAACAQVRAWQDGGLAPLPVAVNLSAKQFQQQDLRATVKDALLRYDVEPRLLELEITESAAMHNAQATAVTLRALKELGVQLSIDDFGTGYSSLSYLKRFPFDFVKIDRSFVTGLPGNQDDASIARAVIGMAHSLAMKVIAEGVETEGQRAFLASGGCDQMQGYLVSRPVPAKECARFLRPHPTAKPAAANASGGQRLSAAA